jgi:OOP family OmpA-OmpF porin
MRLKSRLLNAVAGIACAALIASSLGGCANLQKPRSWGTCAIVGGLLGAGVGAASGIVIADNTAGRHHSDQDTRVYAGVGGAVVGAGLGALAGHYLCDPLIPPPPPPPPPPPSPPPPPPPPPPPVKEKLVLRGVHFDFNKSVIRPGDAAVLDEAASTLKANPNVTINVNGYCDAIGSDEYNLKLSDRRSDAVVDYLVKAGIPSSQLVPHGYGKTDFVATNDTDEGRAQNRRVELVPNQ